MKNKFNLIGASGLELIKAFESCKLQAYLCPANKLTIGYGHVLLPRFDACLFRTMSADTLKRLIDDCQKRQRISNEAKQSLFISKNQAYALLNGDARQVAEYLNSVLHVDVNNNQFNALCSFVFNIGQGNFSSSTLRKLLNAGDFNGAAGEFSRWSFATVNGKKQRMKGLERRRAAEHALFVKPETAT